MATPPAWAAAAASRQMSLQQRGDPVALQRAHRRSMLTHPIQSTGFWVAQGQALTIDVQYRGASPGAGPQVWIVPIATATAAELANQTAGLHEGSNHVIARHDGMIYFAPLNQPGTGEIIVKLSSGGREVPRFVLGRHSAADWRTMLNRLGGEPYAELVGERMILTMPLATLRDQVDDPAAVLTLWDSIVTMAEQQYGLSARNAYPHRATPFQYQFVSKPDLTGGGLSAGNYWLGTNLAGARHVVNARHLRVSGWGPWHELGHHYQMPAMTWSTQTEVTVNLTALYVQRALGQRSRLAAEDRWRQVRAHLAQSQPDYDAQHDEFVRVAMYWQLDLAFGSDFYARLAQRYRSMPVDELPATDEQKRQAFIAEASRIADHDLTPFFDKWGLRASAATRQTLQSMSLQALNLPIWDNHDEDIRHTYGLSQQGLSGRIVLPAVVRAGQNMSAWMEMSSARTPSLSFDWHVPAGFGAGITTFPGVKMRAPYDPLQNAYAPIRVTVSDGRRRMTFGAGVRLTRPGQDAYDDMILAAHGKIALNTDGTGQGSPGDIHGIDRTGAPVRDYYLQKTRFPGPLPLNSQSTPDWRFVGSYNGQELSPAQDFDNLMRASTGRTTLHEWQWSRSGTVGDIYVIDNVYRHTRDYFMLTAPTYWYFPIDGSSNANWHYLGAYDGSQYLRQ